MIDWLNQNAGAVQASATVVLVGVTIFYAWTSSRLATHAEAQAEAAVDMARLTAAAVTAKARSADREIADFASQAHPIAKGLVQGYRRAKHNKARLTIREIDLQRLLHLHEAASPEMKEPAERLRIALRSFLSIGELVPNRIENSRSLNEEKRTRAIQHAEEILQQAQRCIELEERWNHWEGG